MTMLSYDDFFEDIGRFKEKQKKQKQRGLNNYNILASVLSVTDEVRLHSRMIYSLLNPSGNHYQDALFLELFLEVLELEDFGIDVSHCSVHKEYRNIDLYITDGTKHIILENKLHAHDQKNQIKNYVDVVIKENQDVSSDDLYVIYLSLDRTQPSEYGLGGLTIDGDELLKDSHTIASFKSIHYRKEIITWLNKCQHEVQNITNLNETIRQYRDVVKMANNEHKEKISSLSAHIMGDVNLYKMANDIHKTMPKLREKIAEDFFNDIKDKLRHRLGDEWIIELEGDLSKQYKFPFRIYKKAWVDAGGKNSMLFGFEFNENNFHDGALGIVKYSDVVDVKGDVMKNFKAEIESIDLQLKTTSLWLHWEPFPNKKRDDDFCEYIMFDESAKSCCINKLLDFVDLFEMKSGLMTKINRHLSGRA